MIDLFKNVSLYIIRKMCIKSIEVCPCLIGAVPDQYRTKEMRKKAVEKKPWSLKFVPGCTEEMCEKAIEKCAWRLEFVPDHLKMEEMCEKAAEKKTWLLEFV